MDPFGHLVGLFGRGIIPTQGLYLHRTTQHRKTRTHIHAPSDSNVRAAEVSTCLRPRGLRDRRYFKLLRVNTSLDIWVSKVTGYWLNGAFLRRHVQTGSGTRQVSYPVGNGNHFRGDKVAEAWRWSFTSVSCRGRMRVVLPPLLHTSKSLCAWAQRRFYLSYLVLIRILNLPILLITCTQI
jgi:hypothetical protein